MQCIHILKNFIILNTVISLLGRSLNQVIQHVEEIIFMNYCIKHAENMIVKIVNNLNTKGKNG